LLGDGAKTTAVAIEYDAPINGSSLTKATYTVAGIRDWLFEQRKEEWPSHNKNNSAIVALLSKNM
jgi:predicted peptidase